MSTECGMYRSAGESFRDDVERRPLQPRYQQRIYGDCVCLSFICFPHPLSLSLSVFLSLSLLFGEESSARARDAPRRT